tara:strand:- start:3240 stop:3434 length:195 start_codon:yes stop_codon:yes gene_type:complete
MQETLIFCGVGRSASQVWAKGARIGIRHPPVQSLPRGFTVQAIYTIGILLFQGQRKGAINQMLA